MDVPSSVIYEGVKYRLMGAGKYYLSQSRRNEGRRKAKGLHVAIWEHENGATVPNSHCIHHKDGNPFNNNIDNLECIPRDEHLSFHAKQSQSNEEYRAKNLETLVKIRDKAADWHRTDDGKRWHSENSRRSWANRKVLSHTCVCCGKEYKSKDTKTKFCSEACGQRYRYHIKKALSQ